MSALSSEDIAAFDLSLASETYFAEPAVSALTFPFNLFFLINIED